MKIQDIELSQSFKSETKKAVTAIIFFMICYVVMLLIAVALTLACVAGGVALVAAVPRIITFIIGAGIASVGVFVFLFLTKFLFKSHKVDRSHLVEITRNQEPKLFAMIDDIVEQVQTKAPKKVYFSNEVNASVFYDSSFLSMFFPVEKNLMIGVGLINTITASELKAILSHEFGHFSQRTMKVGSYVYHVNQVIFNMLFDNESYENMIVRWAQFGGIFAFFVGLAIKIVQGIQFILRKLYEVVNKSYMALSREMEFHADEIASCVTGYEPLKESLLRMQLADFSFTAVLNHYEPKVKEGVVSQNFYKEHQFVMNFLAEDEDIPIHNSLPSVTVQDLNKFNKSKLVIKDQWASHPSVEERIERLEKTGNHAKSLDTVMAESVLTNPEKTQEGLTNRLLEAVDKLEKKSVNGYSDFVSEFKDNFSKNSFNKIYNGYYDHKNPEKIVLADTRLTDSHVDTDSLYSKDTLEDVYESIGLENDIAALNQIKEKASQIKTFDYDGRKFKKKDCKILIPQLEKELAEIKKKIQLNDQRIYQYFSSLESKQNAEGQLSQLYKSLQEFEGDFNEGITIYERLTMDLEFVGYSLPMDVIDENFRKIRPTEKALKEKIELFLNDETIKGDLTSETRKNFEKYLSKDWHYAGTTQYFEGHLEMLYAAINDFVFLNGKAFFNRKKKLLSYQVTLVSM